MRIVHVISPYFEIREGKFIKSVPKQTIDIALAQKNLGNEVFIATSKGSDSFGLELIETIPFEAGGNKTNSDQEKHYSILQEKLQLIKPDIVNVQLGKVRTENSFAMHYEGAPTLVTIETVVTPDQTKILKKVRGQKGSYISGISETQRKLWGEENFDYVIHHGLDENTFSLGLGEGGYLFNMSRICEDKGIHEALEVAVKTGLPFVLAGNINDENYFESKIKPYLVHKNISYIGALSPEDKVPYIQNASVFINPIYCDEAFGLTMVESPLCGTPVVTYARGAAPEVISNGDNGFLVDPGNLEGIIEAIPKALSLDRKNVRKCSIGKGFTLDSAAKNYLSMYSDILSKFTAS